MLVLLLGNSLLSLKEGFSVLVQLELGDHHIGRVDGDLDLGTYT
jgi:hypothetical protein